MDDLGINVEPLSLIHPLLNYNNSRPLHKTGKRASLSDLEIRECLFPSVYSHSKELLDHIKITKDRSTNPSFTEHKATD